MEQSRQTPAASLRDECTGRGRVCERELCTPDWSSEQLFKVLRKVRDKAQQPQVVAVVSAIMPHLATIMGGPFLETALACCGLLNGVTGYIWGLCSLSGFSKSFQACSPDSIAVCNAAKCLQVCISYRQCHVMCRLDCVCTRQAAGRWVVGVQALCHN